MYAKPTASPLLKLLLVAVIVIELAVVGFLGYQRAQAQGADSQPVAADEVEASTPAETSAPDESAVKQDAAGGEETPAPEPVTLTVTFAGDCTLGVSPKSPKDASFDAVYKKQDANPAYFLQNVADIFGADDLTVVNMEGVLTESDEAADKNFTFKGPAEYSKVLSGSSVEAASMANNHSADYGEQSYTDTIETLDADGVSTFGYDRISYQDVKGVKVALIGANTTGEFHIDPEAAVTEMLSNIAKAKDEGAQLVLVYMHWGIEKDYTPQASDMKVARQAIDAGADLVVGSHPHVVQGWEVYQGRYIVYSLGNFCFGGNANPKDKDCLIFQQTFTVTGDEVAKNDDVKFIACSVSSTSKRNNYQPTPAEGEEAERILAKVQESTDAIAAMAAEMSGSSEGDGDSSDDDSGSGADGNE